MLILIILCLLAMNIPAHAGCASLWAGVFTPEEHVVIQFVVGSFDVTPDIVDLVILRQTVGSCDEAIIMTPEGLPLLAPG